MKRITLYTIFNIILLSIFVVSLVIQAYIPLLNLPVRNYWFPLFCFLVGISLFIKCLLFKSDSSLFFSLILLLVSISIIVISVTKLSYGNFWPIFIVIPAVTSLIVGLLFKDSLLIKIFVFFSLISVPLFLLSFKVLAVGWFVLVLFGFLILAIYLGSLIPERLYRKTGEGSKTS